jgi:hypothetical protein
VRVSANPYDPAHQPWHVWCEVRLDGEVVPYVQTADSDQGVIILLETNERGQFLPDGMGGLRRQVRRGRVEIGPAPGAPAFVHEYLNRSGDR